MSLPPNPDDAPVDAAFAALEPGFLVGSGRFTLVRLIGRGGMGVVWLARDESLREDVALKFLPSEIRFDAVALDDLRRETARARKLTHPNIIRIHDLFKDERDAFISMEYVDGPNLSELRLEQPGRVFSWKFLEPFVKQLCEALDYAHGEKVIHRDLKPANMMLDSRRRLKLSDFGIAAQVSDSVARVSMLRHGQSGTITHMSPQQMDGKLPQVTDDIYALGATLYELLTSQTPFFTGDIAYQVRNLPPQPVRERLADLGIQNDVPKPVAAMIMACLGKTPEQRPQTAGSVAEWIGLQPSATAPAPVLTSSFAVTEEAPDGAAPETPPPPAPVQKKTRTAAPPPPQPAIETAEEDSTETVTAEHETSHVRSRKLLIIGVVAVVVLAGFGVGVFAWRLLDRGALSGSKSSSAQKGTSSSDFLKGEHVLVGHKAAVSSVTFSPNQEFLISGSADGTVRAYETKDGELKWSANADVGAVTSVSVSRENKLLAAAGGNGLIRLFALGSGEVISTLRVHSSPVTGVAFSPAGTYLASADESGIVSLWDYPKGAAVHYWKAHSLPVRALAFAPNGTRIASGSGDYSVRVWNVPDGALLKALSGHKAVVWSVAFSADGSMLVSSSRDRSARIWNTGSFSSKRTIQWGSDANIMHGIAFSPDSRFIAAGSPRVVKVFKVETAARGTDRTLKASGMMRPVAFSPDGSAIAAGGDNGLVHVWPFPGEALFGGTAPTSLASDEPTNAISDVTGADIAAPSAVTAKTTDEFIELFNGRDLSGWSGDRSVWSVRGDAIHGRLNRKPGLEPSCLFWRGGTLEDFELRFSFRLLGGNAGVYYRANAIAGFGAGGYQFDILPDRPGNFLETGSDRSRRVLFRVPATVAPIPLGSWHEAAIVASGESIQYQLDGRVLCNIVDKVPEHPRSGLLALEAIGGPTEVEFKNLRLKSMSAREGTTSAQNWITLFDGNSLDAWQGWKGAGWIGAWELFNGELRSLRGGSVNLATREQFGDFELEFEWRVAPGANSGVFYRVPANVSELQKAAPEYQVVDDATRDGRNSLTAAGSIYGVMAAANKQLRPVGSFNTARIVTRGRQVEHWLNGVKILSADLGNPTLQRVAFQRYSKAWGEADRGHIVLQNLGTEVSFRNIRVRGLD